MKESSILLLIFLTIVTSQNCSTYNPCGPYGYCRNNDSDVWECQCKFWWYGTYCNQMTGSGIQVIVLGVLLAIVIILFYGLAIYCSIRRKKQNSNNKSKRVNKKRLTDSKLAQVALVNVKQSARCSSFIVAILMCTVAVLALIVKWLLLKPIHNELVSKYNAEDLLFYERNGFCDLIDLEDFNLLTIGVGVFFILIFVVISKRTSCLSTKLRGYVGPVVPLDFYIHVKRTFAAVVFAIIADELLDIINQILTGNTSTGLGVIVDYLIRISIVLVIGLRYYPILAAIHIDTLVSLSCATVYAWFDFSLSIVSQSLCQSDFYPSNANFNETNGTDLAQFFEYYGTGQNLIIIQLCSDIPRYLCWGYIVVKLPTLLLEKLYKKIKRQKHHNHSKLHLTRDEKIFLHSSVPYSVEMLYVKNLFRAPEQLPNTRSFISRILPKRIYHWRDDFRFSSRVVSVYASVFLLLIFLTIQFCVQVVPYLATLQTFLQNIINLVTSFNSAQSTSSDFPLPNFVTPYVMAIITAVIITAIQLLLLLASIRRNLFQIFRGDDTEIPKRNSSNYVSYGTGNFHFAGYFIGYLVWGYILIALLAFIIYISIDAFIKYGSVRFLESILKLIIPVLLLIFFKQYLNKFLARYVFLQEYGAVLAINNRRVLMIFLYFNFFLDSFLGFVSSIIRILKSIVGGILFMCRLDYSPLGRKLEAFDAGFSAYCGFIHLEAAHRNPILLVFASYLYGIVKMKQHAESTMITSVQDNKNKPIKSYSSRAVRKWHLAVLLMRNPSFMKLRKNRLVELANEKAEDANEKRRKVTDVEAIHRASLISETDLETMWQKKR